MSTLRYTTLKEFKKGTRNGPNTFNFFFNERYERDVRKQIRKALREIIEPNFKVLSRNLSTCGTRHVPHKDFYYGRHGESDEEAESSYEETEYCFTIRLEDPLAKYYVKTPERPRCDNPTAVAEQLKTILSREHKIGIVWGKTITAERAQSCKKVCTTTIPVLNAVVLADALSILDNWNVLEYVGIPEQNPHDFVITVCKKEQ